MPAASHFASWNAAIRTYTANCQHAEAVHVFRQMRRSGFLPDFYAFAAAVKSCAAISGTRLGESLHGFAAKDGYSVTAAAGKALMDMYARFGMMHDAWRVFDEMGHRDSVSWNVLLSGYSRLQLHAQVTELFYSMHVCDDAEVRPNSISVAIILPVCARLRALKSAQSVHGYVTKTGIVSETLAGNALVSMYSKCGLLVDDARRAFSLVACKDVISWNSMIAGYAENGFVEEALSLFFQMVSSGVRPNYSTIASVLPLCFFFHSGWCWGKVIHCHVLRFGLEADISVCNALMVHYARVGDMKGAEDVFRSIHTRDVVSWNTLILGFAMNGSHSRALDLFLELLSTGMALDSVTVITILPVCAQLHDVQQGREIHDYVSKEPMLSQDTSVGNALVSFYGKCGDLDDAIRTFQGILKKDLISWNAMLSVYADNEKWEGLIAFLTQMLEQGIRPDSITVLGVLQACAALGARMIKELHGYSIRAGLMHVPNVGNALLDAYAKCGSIESVLKTFESLPEHNVISGNTMISVFAKHGLQEEADAIFDGMQVRDLGTCNLMVQVYAKNDSFEKAVDIFHELQCQGMRPDAVSIMSILPVCARLASVHLVNQCHGYVVRAFLDDLHLGGALLDTYSKCGSINDAYKLFKINPENDIITFTAMVSGFAMNGMAEEALRVFSEMFELGIKPDHVIMTSLLSACSHAGLVDEGWKYFKSIDEIHGIKHTMEHYACLVDLLARRGRVREAYSFIEAMPCEANASIWGTLLGACKTYGEVEIGRLAAERLFNIEAGNIGNYVVMSNIYAADGRWDGVEEVRGLMKSKELRKPAGCSWIEVEKMRHVFVAGDLSHPQRSFIYYMLKTLDKQAKEQLI